MQSTTGPLKEIQGNMTDLGKKKLGKVRKKFTTYLHNFIRYENLFCFSVAVSLLMQFLTTVDGTMTTENLGRQTRQSILCHLPLLS